MSPRATSKLWWWIVSKALDLKRPIREADPPLRNRTGGNSFISDSGYYSLMSSPSRAVDSAAVADLRH